MKKYVLSVMVNNNAGVLSHVSGLFSRRGYNIDSVSVGESEQRQVSRMTIVVTGDKEILEQIKNQLSKLVDVLEITEYNAENAVLREHVLIKIDADHDTRSSIIEVANIFRSGIVNVKNDSLTLELTGSPSKITAFLEFMSQYNVSSIVRTGLTALGR